MKDKKLTTIINYVLAALMLVYVILTFVPYVAYTSYSGDAVTSIQQYVWLVPEGVTEYVQSFTDGYYDINSAVLGPIVCSLCSIIGMFICIIFSRKGASAILPFIVGIVGLADCLTNPFIKLGNIWIVHIFIFAVILVLSVINAVTFFRAYEERRKAGIY